MEKCFFCERARTDQNIYVSMRAPDGALVQIDGKINPDAQVKIPCCSACGAHHKFPMRVALLAASAALLLMMGLWLLGVIGPGVFSAVPEGEDPGEKGFNLLLYWGITIMGTGIIPAIVVFGTALWGAQVYQRLKPPAGKIKDKDDVKHHPAVESLIRKGLSDWMISDQPD